MGNWHYFQWLLVGLWMSLPAKYTKLQMTILNITRKVACGNTVIQSQKLCQQSSVTHFSTDNNSTKLWGKKKISHKTTSGRMLGIFRNFATTQMSSLIFQVHVLSLSINNVAPLTGRNSTNTGKILHINILMIC